MNKTNVTELIAYCSKDDPLNEIWLWAQAAGIGIAIAFMGCALFTLCNCWVVSYAAIMSKICSTEFNTNVFSAWQDTVTSVSILLGLALSVAALFAKISLRARFGASVVKRNIQVSMDLDAAARLCKSIMPEESFTHKGTPKPGQITMYSLLQEGSIADRHLILRAVTTGPNETTILIDAVPVIKGQWTVLSALFCDFGDNRDRVNSMVSQLKPYMSNKRAAAPFVQPKQRGPSAEQIRKEAPPMLLKKPTAHGSFV